FPHRRFGDGGRRRTRSAAQLRHDCHGRWASAQCSGTDPESIDISPREAHERRTYRRAPVLFPFRPVQIRGGMLMSEHKRFTRIGVGLGVALSLALVGGSTAGSFNVGAATVASAAKPVLTMGLTNYTATLNPALAGGGDQSMPISLAY